ncbi:unnamed protein product [Caenorhabditis sp. 36 PRJEB53466]|nr:unnamed protein product [Caenorhabditis sp. 36 PRJEB53466]
MKYLFLASLLALFAIHPTYTEREVDLFNFHEKTLAQFNQARRIIASGSAENLLRFLRSALSVFKQLQLPNVGPAANMYKMRWSREMEQVAYRIYNSGDEDLMSKKIMPALESVKGYKHFTWMGNILDVLKTILDVLPESWVDSLHDLLELIETIIIVIWMAWNYPPAHEKPINHNKHHASAEALFASRYEIGCYSNLIFGVCVVRDSREDEMLFEPGVACYNCPVGSHCEWTRLPDGYFEEGELCTAPDPNGTMILGKANGTTISPKGAYDNLSGNPTIYLAILVISCFFLFRRSPLKSHKRDNGKLIN